MNGYLKLLCFGIWTLFIFSLAWWVHTRFDEAEQAAVDSAELVALQAKQKADNARANDAELRLADVQTKYQQLLMDNQDAKNNSPKCNLPSKWLHELAKLPTATGTR